MKVKKSTKKPAPTPKDVSALVERIAAASEDDLVPILRTFNRWQFPRGDLHAWIPVLDHFDSLLEEITNSYGLSKLQTNDFTPKTKELLLEILRVERLLLENCTNRRLFASYDRVADLLLTSDLDVLKSAVFLLLRPAQQYASQTPLDTLKHTILSRLQSLSRDLHGADNEQHVELQYYPNVAQSSRTKVSPGPSTLEIDLATLPENHAEHIALLAETHHIAMDDQYVAYNRIRRAKGDADELLVIRLLSLAAYLCILSEDSATSVFLYEPNLVTFLTTLLRSDSDDIRMASLLALDACVHHQAKTTEIMTTLCANVNHGLIVTHFREMIPRLASTPPELVDATMALVAFISSSPVHINMLMGAGILRILLDMLGAVGPWRESYIPRATGLIDSIIFSTPQALSNFSNVDGVNTLVHRVKIELDRPSDASLNSSPTSLDIISDDTAITSANNPLKGLLRCLHRLMQASGGTEGLRNLVDSDLPRSLKRIFEDPDKYGPRVYSLAVNVMATFVHNEPTSLTILQELQLPQTLYTQLERGIPPCYEVISTISTAIGAVCLNQAGLDYTQEHPEVITNLVEAACAPLDEDRGRQLGSLLDELGRHHPAIRPIILRAVMSVLKNANDNGAAFTPPETERQEYVLEEMSQEGPHAIPTNPCLTTFARIYKVLGGLLRNAATAKEFVKEGGLSAILAIADLPCLPVRFGLTETAINLAHLLKYIGEHEHVILISTMMASIQDELEKCSDVWRNDSVVKTLHDQQLKPLWGVAVRLSFLTEAILALSFSHARIATSLIKALGSVSDLGQLHRVCMRATLEPPEENDAARKFIASRLHAVFAKYFAAIIRLIFVKRNPDSAHVTESTALANRIGGLLVSHLQELRQSAAANTTALGAVTSLLFDGRGLQGHLNTTLFVAFVKQGGLSSLTTSITSILDAVDKDVAAADVRVTLSLLAALVTPQALLESAETHALESRPRSQFHASDLFVQVRLALYPLVHRIWQSTWLTACPTATVKLAVRAYATLMQGKSEDPHEAVALAEEPMPAPLRPPAALVVDTARVDQLVDMGFSRGPAERALLRARNNVAAATELMLSMPHVFQDFQDAPSVPRAPEPPVAATPDAPVVTEDVPTGNSEDVATSVAETPTPAEADASEAADTISPSIAREDLKRLREGAGDPRDRALTLLDHAEDLVFDLLPLFPSGHDGVRYLIDRLNDVATDYDVERAQTLSARLRLLSVHLRAVDALNLDLPALDQAAQILSILPLDVQSPRPSWHPALLLFAEVVFASSLATTKAKIGDEAGTSISQPSSPTLAAAGSRLGTVCTQLISAEDVTRDELIAALRLLALLSRLDSNFDIAALLKPFRSPSDKLLGCHTFLAIILRHAFEDNHALTHVMRREIREWLSPARNKVTDINFFVRQLRQAASRNPACFVKAVGQECTLVDPTPPQSVYHIRAKDKPNSPSSPPIPVGSHSDPFQDSSDQTHPVIVYMLLELSNTVIKSLDLASEAPTANESHGYSALLMSLLTELLGSYLSVKKAFLASVRHFSVKTRGIPAIVNDLICCIVLTDVSRTSQPARHVAISSWASSMVVALCSDVMTVEDTDAQEETVHIRKVVLDVVAKAIRDSGSQTDPNIRYGRLWALGELIYRLLTARSKVATKSPSESSLHIAKIMLEKNFVSLITAALGEVDLNYPDVRNVLISLLRSLENLSKLSVKWGKTNKPREDNIGLSDDGEDSTSADSESDVDMLEDEEEQMAPDLYRNSALGMIGGELGDDDEDDEDEDEEDDEDMDMGDEVTDDEDGTATQTSEEESLADALEQEDWDEDMEDESSENGEELDPEVLLGSAADEEEWEDAPDDQPSITTEEQQAIDDEEEDEAGGFFEDDEDELADMDLEEEEFDEMDMLDVMPQTDFQPSAAASGSWGWAHQSSNATANRHRSIFTDDPAISLFGAPPRPSTSASQHPLVADPSIESPSLALPRSIGNNYNELLAAINRLGGSDAVRLLESLLTHRHVGNHGTISVEVSQDPSGNVGLTVGGRTVSFGHLARQNRTPPADVTTEFTPVPTMHRWQDEMSLFPSAQNTELTGRMVIHIVNDLMPEARRRAEEEEQQQRQQRDDEERAAARAVEEQVASAANVALPESRQPSPDSLSVDDDVPMADSAQASLARTVISIHGRDVDITDTGIDLEFLQALPDDMRADVVEQHLREQSQTRRPAPPNIPTTASQINPDFLNALPPDIRAEVIMQEAMENARRNAPQPPSGQPAGFLASLTDELRDVMLLGQPGGGLPADELPGAGGLPASSVPKKTRREAIQLLEKPGLASLVRLLFFPETLKKGHLFKVLVNLCENSSSRADLLNLLLSIVQDGSGDLPAVDRSFQQMSLKPAVTPKGTPKAKTIDSPATVVPAGLFAHLQTEHVPTYLTQRCFEALLHVVNSNNNAAAYFLQEHEQVIGTRRQQSKKGKGKEKTMQQSKYPIVILLGLLDRPLLAKTSGLMENVTALLVTVTKPLTESNSGKNSESDSASLLRPVIPPSVLRLIVNCLTCGECNSRTFSQTLLVMQNLSCLPEAKDVILQELQTRCHELGLAVQGELQELDTALQAEASDIDSSTLGRFSSPTAKQAQLLRLLKTIDYLHINKVESERKSGDMSEEERKVSAIFDSFDFSNLWKQLGQCLSKVGERESTDQIATVLLPLVEALMVMSKYRNTNTSRASSLPPSSAGVVETGDLFVSFTTTHRKVLNTIVRNNPTLLSGSFSLLIRNPRVLEFDNKRNWFFQKLKRKREAGVPTNVLHLNIRRQDVFTGSYFALQGKTGDEIKYGKLSVKFHNEDGVDAGGVTREWYSVLAQQIFDPNFALFEPCAADKQTYQPNKASSVNEVHLSYFKFVGRIIGKAVYDGRLLDAYFNRAFYKQILGRTVDMRDLESIDPEYHKSLQWMLDNDITGIIDQEFTIEDDQFGEKKIVELKENGSAIPVTEENKDEYVRLVVSYRLDNSIKDQIKAFLEGFYDIIPRELIQIFEPDQLELLISGITTVDVDELKNATQLSGWKASDPEIGWFWRALRSFSQEERSRFLMFVTSSSRVPLGGFTQLQGSSGIQPFQMQKLYAKEGSLPQASTCFNLLLLPTYASYEQLRDRLHFAIVETGGFGKA